MNISCSSILSVYYLYIICIYSAFVWLTQDLQIIRSFSGILCNIVVGMLTSRGIDNGKRSQEENTARWELIEKCLDDGWKSHVCDYSSSNISTGVANQLGLCVLNHTKVAQTQHIAKGRRFAQQVSANPANRVSNANCQRASRILPPRRPYNPIRAKPKPHLKCVCWSDMCQRRFIEKVCCIINTTRFCNYTTYIQCIY